MKKYNIVRIDVDYTVDVMGTFLLHKDAIEELTSIMKEEYKDKNAYRVSYNAENGIYTVNYIGYFGKSLYAKYFIVEFEDNTNNEEVDNE